MFSCCNILRFRLQNYCFFCIYTNILEEKSLNEGDFYKNHPSIRDCNKEFALLWFKIR